VTVHDPPGGGLPPQNGSEAESPVTVWKLPTFGQVTVSPGLIVIAGGENVVPTTLTVNVAADTHITASWKANNTYNHNERGIRINEFESVPGKFQR
jgi:hypothetical protein